MVLMLDGMDSCFTCGYQSNTSSDYLTYSTLLILTGDGDARCECG